ncbi:hypothetical protein F4820DRAFT_110884 [Hypoxylon rubiginosum]|uniref:Uncharacterized protein n=1 Tax=Hypoxylon rubiginosum TaxID=110542 RepID=A0ACB9ZBJ7_9PEZI|nr:hypothetical protein F4820DRAFT_110884 [Hypoxylon rubiginosum]
MVCPAASNLPGPILALLYINLHFYLYFYLCPLLTSCTSFPVPVPVPHHRHVSPTFFPLAHLPHHPICPSFFFSLTDEISFCVLALPHLIILFFLPLPQVSYLTRQRGTTVYSLPFPSPPFHLSLTTSS